jgi:hypothetical protein
VPFTEAPPDSTGWNIWSMRSDSSSSAKPFLQTPFLETGAHLSPDGRWVAYYSNETGRKEVYVQSFPEKGEKVVISTGGGRDPVWDNGGRTIYCWQGDQLTAASVAVNGQSMSLVSRDALFRYGSYITGAHSNYDVSPDGRSFVVVSGGVVANRLSVLRNSMR